MGIASQSTKGAGSSLLPKQAFPQASMTENVNSTEKIYTSEYEDINCHNDGNSVLSNSPLVLGRTRNCAGNESNTDKNDFESSKTVQKKRGRGRPPKLKPNKQEKEMKIYTFHSPMKILDIKALHTTIAHFSKEKKRQVPKN